MCNVLKSTPVIHADISALYAKKTSIPRSVSKFHPNTRLHSPSHRGSVQTSNKLNPPDMFLGQPVIIGDEQVDLKSASTSKLNSVRWTNSFVLSNQGVGERSRGIKRNDCKTRTAEEGTVPIC